MKYETGMEDSVNYVDLQSHCHIKINLFSNDSAVKREQIIFTLNSIKCRQESGMASRLFITTDNTGAGYRKIVVVLNA